MQGLLRSFGRLLVLQASWTYERMQGIGIGFASAPLLAPLRDDPEQYRAATARAAEYFNANPYLAGLAVGAAARAETDRVPGETIRRLKTALAGPLGSLGDQLFWVGVVPALEGLTLLGLAHGAPAWTVAVLVVTFNLIRLSVTYWGLLTGSRAGLGIAAALARSRLTERAERVGHGAGLAVGAALPSVAAWFWNGPAGAAGLAVAAGAALGGAAAARAQFRVPSSRVITLGGLLIVYLWHWRTQ
jgi:mannose/fructose/N-acetylgalactosamine-specific phosphotransferase system component IID